MKAKYSLLLASILAFSAFGEEAQQKAPAPTATDKPQVVVDKSSRLWLDGDSTLHKFKAEAGDFRASFNFQADSDAAQGPLTFESLANSGAIKGVELSLPVYKLTSGEKGLDENMWKSLKVKQHPRISFRMESYQMSPAAPEGSFTVKLSGRLSIAGVEKPVEITARAVRESQGLRVTGSKELLMTDFGIEPPTMMLGTIRTDNRIVVGFNLHFRLQPPATAQHASR